MRGLRGGTATDTSPRERAWALDRRRVRGLGGSPPSRGGGFPHGRSGPDRRVRRSLLLACARVVDRALRVLCHERHERARRPARRRAARRDQGRAPERQDAVPLRGTGRAGAPCLAPVPVPQATARPDRVRGWHRCRRGAAGPGGARVRARPADPPRVGSRARPHGRALSRIPRPPGSSPEPAGVARRWRAVAGAARPPLRLRTHGGRRRVDR
jgi:hypothetical protein